MPERVRSSSRKVNFNDEDGEPAQAEEEPEDDDSDNMDDFIEGDEEEAPRVSRRAVSRRSRDSYGPSRDQLDEARDIFGDDYEEFEEVEDEELEGDEGEAKEEAEVGAIRAQYEHSELVESFITENDEILRRTDHPERLIKISKHGLVTRIKTSDEDRLAESNWIMMRLLNDGILSADDVNNKEVSQSIQSILNFFIEELLDAPFIWTYRRDYIHRSIDRATLWRILSLDEDWLALSSKRKGLLAELHALEDACSSNGVEVDEDHQHLVLQDLENSREVLHMNVEEASITLSRLRNIAALSDASFVNKDQEDSAKRELDDLQVQLKETEGAIEKQKEAIRSNARRRQLRAKYSVEIATKVLHLFPVQRYRVLIESARDENELRDISKFLSLVIRGCKGHETNLEKKRVRLISDLEDYYRFCKIPELRNLLESFTVAASDIGEGLRYGIALKTEPLAPTVHPSIAVASLIDRQLPSGDAVTRAVRILLATEVKPRWQFIYIHCAISLPMSPQCAVPLGIFTVLGQL